MNITAIGVDLSKHVYMVHAVNAKGGMVYRAKMEPERFIREMAQKAPSSACVYMEACSGAHYLCWKLATLGIEAKQIDAREVKKYASHQKNDYRDAEAIAIAGTRENTTFVPVKSKEILELQVQIRIRARLVRSKTALMNEIRGFLAEQGVVINKSKSALTTYLFDGYRRDETLSASFRQSIDSLIEEFNRLDEQLDGIEKRLKRQAKESPVAEALQSIPGVGWLTALCIIAAYGDGSQFKNGRHMSAATGLVPRQFTTGGKPVLGKITKHGNAYLRYLLIHGGRAVLRAVIAKKKTDKHSLWIQKLYELHGYKKTSVAIANKNARIAFRLLRDPSVRFNETTAHTKKKEFEQKELLTAAN